MPLTPPSPAAGGARDTSSALSIAPSRPTSCLSEFPTALGPARFRQVLLERRPDVSQHTWAPNIRMAELTVRQGSPHLTQETATPSGLLWAGDALDLGAGNPAPGSVQ